MLAARKPSTELQHSNLSAVHRALQRHRSVKEAIMVQATGRPRAPGELPRHRDAELAVRGRSLGAGPRPC